jgi:hypothetical protein
LILSDQRQFKLNSSFMILAKLPLASSLMASRSCTKVFLYFTDFALAAALRFVSEVAAEI